MGGGGKSPHPCLLPPASSGGAQGGRCGAQFPGPVLLLESPRACNCCKGFSPAPSTQGLRPRRCRSQDH